MTKENKFKFIDYIFNFVFLGLLIYASYSLWFIFYGTDSSSDVHLYTVISGMSLGWFSYFFINTVTRKGGKLKLLFSLICGNLFFQGLIWGINSKINSSCLFNDSVIIYTFTVTFIIATLLLFIGFLIGIKKINFVNVILSLLSLGLCCGCLYNFNAENIRAIEFKAEISFDSITISEMKLTDEEISLCEKWYQDNFVNNNGEYPFSFKVDGIEFSSLEWKKEIKTVVNNSVYLDGNTEYIILTNIEKGIEVTVEVTIFKNNATCQWKVFIKNINSENSGIISEFYAFNSELKTDKSELYYSMGSNTAASDFSLIKKNLTSLTKSFSASDGKSSEKFLPYFNLCGENVGYVLGIGWTGQWYASFAQKDDATEISVKQEDFQAYLLPEEEVRSPLVSITFYNNDNALKGFNLFRRWVMDCVYPENITKNYYTVIEVAGPESVRTSDEIIEILNSINDTVYENTDAFWMDAGWYNYTNGWYDGVGNWTADNSRYDNGIIELSSYAKEKGLGHVLWYEPERVAYGTEFHNIGEQHEQWLIYGEDNIMWNLADQDAFSYYCEYLLNSLKENGVTIYRQDFNFAPLEYWQKADKEFYDGRIGICENHYVTNLYRFLDYLTDNIDGLIIDNCASGGKRLDLEMTYRSIPFWRSDYNCSYHPDLFNATQSHTYGISFWLPISGSALYMHNEYSMRSDIMPLILMDFFANAHTDFSFYNEQRAFMSGNYYPLEHGSFDNDRVLAMEFSDKDGLNGVVFVYKRSEVLDINYNLVFNGLDTEREYKIYDVDYPEKIYRYSGAELMNNGFNIDFHEGEKAFIIMFNTEN